MKALTMIKPTIGRRVWYWPSEYDLGLLEHKPSTVMTASDPRQACDAGVAYVHSDRCINIAVADHNGVVHQRTSVTLLQEGDAVPIGNAYAEWMPYQVNAAAKEVAPVSAIERAILDKGLTAPRVLPTEIDALMKRIVYVYDVQPAGTTSTFAHAFLDGDFLLASGHSACVSKVNFNEDIGKDIARNDAEGNARKKLWELQGYLLRDKLRRPEPTFNTEGPDDFQG